MTYLSFSEYSILWECEEHVRLHGGTLTEGEAPVTVKQRKRSPSVSVPLPITARGKAPAWTPPRRPQEAPRRLATERLKELLG